MKSDFYEEYFHHENTHWWFRWRFDLIGDVVGSLTKGKSDVKILDAGCGTGQMTKLLEGYGEAVGLDLAPEAINYAKIRGVKNLVQGSITEPPFEPGSFDLVVSLDVIEHVDNDMQILAGLRDIVRPGGHLVVTVPAFQMLWSEHDEINHHKRRYRVPQLRHLVQEAGFEVSRITYCNTALYLPVLALRKGKTLLRKLRGTSTTPNPESDLVFYPKPVNEALYQIMRLENRIMRGRNLPFGVSILVVAQRPASDVVQTETVADAPSTPVRADASPTPVDVFVSAPVREDALVAR